MSGPSGLDSTQKSFPPYADLTQTQGWARPPTPIRADTNEAAEAVEILHHVVGIDDQLLDHAGQPMQREIEKLLVVGISFKEPTFGFLTEPLECRYRTLIGDGAEPGQCCGGLAIPNLTRVEFVG